MKPLTLAILLVLPPLGFGAAAQAAWQIDAARFHASVHGRLGCGDCHDHVGAERPHPDPADVNRRAADFFDPETCRACHDEVFEAIAAGGHGGRKVTDGQPLDRCTACHDPHYQFDGASGATLEAYRAAGEKRCGLCHPPEAVLPAFARAEEGCLTCHVAFPGEDPRGIRDTAAVCRHCHAAARRSEGAVSESHPLIDFSLYASTPHRDLACTACHPRAMAFGHGQQETVDCVGCHPPHGARQAHDLHAAVACQACHLDPVAVFRDPRDGAIGWHSVSPPDRLSSIHRMPLPEKDESCRRCHHENNTLGAAAMVLPAKSVVCMPCHAATFSAADALTVLSLAVFLLGMAVVGSVWFSGGRAAADAGGTPTRPFRAAAGALLPGRILAIAGSLFLDGFLQRRLYAASRARWFWHALVFYPVAFRFAWGIAALLGSLWLPGWPATRAVLDKNHPLTASLFDLSGLLVVVGILGMAWRRRPGREAVGGTGLAPVDWPAFILLTGIMGVGFVLEGMRIAMTGTPPGAAWAFAGYALSRTMTGIELAGVYGHVWYLHAGLTAAFVAYLPFSRMRHMIMAPLSLAIGAAARFRRP